MSDGAPYLLLELLDKQSFLLLMLLHPAPILVNI